MQAGCARQQWRSACRPPATQPPSTLDHPPTRKPCRLMRFALASSLLPRRISSARSGTSARMERPWRHMPLHRHHGEGAGQHWADGGAPRAACRVRSDACMPRAGQLPPYLLPFSRDKKHQKNSPSALTVPRVAFPRQPEGVGGVLGEALQPAQHELAGVGGGALVACGGGGQGSGRAPG